MPVTSMLTMDGTAIAVTSRPTGRVVIRMNLASCFRARWAFLGIVSDYGFGRARTGNVK